MTPGCRGAIQHGLACTPSRPLGHAKGKQRSKPTDANGRMGSAVDAYDNAVLAQPQPAVNGVIDIVP
jgi:hypothetical protein